VVVTAGLMVANVRSVPLYVAVLATSAVSRFLLSALSVALPHVTPASKLVVANAVSDTIGGMMSALGGIAALGINAATGDTERGAAVTMLVGGGCYAAAGLVATIMPRNLLGPAEVHRGTGRFAGDLAEVAAGLAAGARYVLGRRGPRAALGATSAYSFLFGPLFLMSILLYRNYFYRSASANTALSHFLVLVIVSAVGYACAALITPQITKRMSKPAWIALLLASAAVVVGPLGQTFSQAAFLVIGFWLNLAGQGVAICATTILQEQVDDSYRGRVFAFYDMTFNITFVAGAALSAVFMPASGHSPVIVGLVGVGFAVASAGYWVSSREGPGGGGELPSPASPAQRRSS
jgi:hypothetical protein